MILVITIFIVILKEVKIWHAVTFVFYLLIISTQIRQIFHHIIMMSLYLICILTVPRDTISPGAPVASTSSEVVGPAALLTPSPDLISCKNQSHKSLQREIQHCKFSYYRIIDL